MKTCNKCGETKALSDFYGVTGKPGSLALQCKECVKRRVRKNYAAKRVEYHRYEQLRNANENRRSDRARAAKMHRKLHPERRAARVAVSNAVRVGRLIKQPCRFCGTTKMVQAHHHDYSKPLDVLWECFKCHREKDHGQVVTTTEFQPGPRRKDKAA